VASDVELSAMVAAHPEGSWDLVRTHTEGALSAWSLECTSCADSCESLSVGWWTELRGGWQPARPADEQVVLSVQPMTGEVGLEWVGTSPAGASVPWPASLSVEGRTAEGPVELVRFGDAVVVPKGELTLEGGGRAQAPLQVGPEAVVLHARDLGLTGGVTVRVRQIPGASMVLPVPSTWDGDEVVVAYRQPRTVTEGRSRLQGPHRADVLSERLRQVEAARAAWPGLRDGPWLHVVGDVPRAHAQGLVVSLEGPVAWGRHALPEGASERLVAAVEHWERGVAQRPDCLGVLSLPVERAGPAGAWVLQQLAQARGAEPLRALLATLSRPDWLGVLEVMTPEERERLAEVVGL
jgi:hypothetical protein